MSNKPIITTDIPTRSPILFSRRVGEFNLLNPRDKSASLCIRLPDWAPVAQKYISVCVEIGGDHDVRDNVDPWEAADAIESHMKELLYCGNMRENMIAIEWMRANEAELRVDYYASEYKCLKNRIGDLEKDAQRAKNHMDVWTEELAARKERP